MDIRKKLPNPNADLPNLVAKNFAYLSDWVNQNEPEFERVMSVLAQQNPAKYADVYVKAMQILSVQSKVPAKMKVEHVVKDEDIAKLQRLSGEKRDKFDEYEEVK